MCGILPHKRKWAYSGVTKTKTRILIGIISASFLLLLAIQFHWTHQSVRFAQKQFEQNVRKSFHTLNRDLEKKEAAFYYRRSLAHKKGMYRWHQKMDSLRMRIGQGIEKHIDCVAVDNGRNDRVVFKQVIRVENGGQQEEITMEFDVSDSGNVQRNIEEALARKERQMEHIFIEMMSAEDTLYGDRMGLDSMEQHIREALLKNGIRTDFNYALVRHTFLGSEMVQSSEVKPDRRSAYRSPLMPGLLGRGKSELVISFPEQHIFIGRKVWLMLVSSLLLIIVLISAFYYSIRNLIRQRKVAEMKNDFISNMTHELKTPITSINLACETINDDSFPFTRESVSNYIRVISDENKRLKTLVNNVLDSSFADSDKLSLKLETVNAEQLVRDVIQRFSVILERNNGTVVLDVQTSKLEVVADKFHLSNAVFNLIDNGIKYTKTSPEIDISIQESKNGLAIRVKDKGIGISKAEQKNIFEKFHRVSTGNVHDVKGFGLGLSYVQRVAELHKGAVTVQSEPGKGSTFTLTLPQ